MTLSIDNVIKCLIIIMILFVSIVVLISIARGIYDYTGMVVGTVFIFILIFLKWMIKEMGIENNSNKG